MKKNQTSILAAFGYRFVGLSSFAVLAGACAQTNPSSVPLDFSGTVQGPRSLRMMDTSILAPPPTVSAPDAPFWQLGPVNMNPRLLYRFTYGDGIPAQANDRIKTAINEVHPGILFEVGRHWRLDYSPSFRFYSDDHFRNTIGQSVALDWSTTYQAWSLGASQRYTATSDPLIETGAQTDTDTYATELNARYIFNSKASLEMELNQDFRFVGQNASTQRLVDSKVWSTMDWFNYQFWPNFGVAVGLGAGYIDLSAGTAMSFEQLQGRVIWRATEKINLQVSAGLEDRQFLDVNTSDSINPLFGASLNYRPFEVTSISLNATRSMNTSFLYGQVTENTDISLGFKQRLFEVLTFDLTGGYRILDYQATMFGMVLSRQDDSTFINARLSVPFFKRGTAGIFYRVVDNTSSDTVFQRSSTQVGCDINYRF
jgi:hypothetical protein